MSLNLIAAVFCLLSASAWAMPVTVGPIPSLFMANKGQVHTLGQMPEVLYHLSSRGLNISLASDGIYYTFVSTVGENRREPGQSFRAEGMSVTLVGANPHPRISAEEPSSFRAQFLNGAKQVETRGYSRIVYHEVYPNIDWEIYLSKVRGQEGVEHDFIIRPGGRPSDIRLKYTGARTLSVNRDGSLLATAKTGRLLESKPIAFSTENKSRTIHVRYQLQGDEIKYAVHKPARCTMVIDPQVMWVTYFGNYNTFGKAVACDTAGNAFLAGSTSTAISQMAVIGGLDTTFGGSNDAFLIAFSRAGLPKWATYFGAVGPDYGNTVTVDRYGDIYLCGVTANSSSIATAGSFQTGFGGGNDGFIAKFSSSGALRWATYYGGSGSDLINSAACDSFGNLYIGGYTTSTSGIATVGSYRSIMAANEGDAFAAKFDSSGARLWGTYFGGTKEDAIQAICPDNNGHVFIAGTTQSGDSIATPGAFRSSSQVAFGVNQIAPFLAKLDASTGMRDWATYYGKASLQMSASALACDEAGNVYFAGNTNDSSSGFATPGSHQSTFGGKSDVYVAKFNTNGGRIWCTYYGGSDDDGVSLLANNIYLGLEKIGLSLSGNRLWLASFTRSTNNIATAGSYQDSAATTPITGDIDAFVALFDTSGKRSYATYIASTGTEGADGISCNASGDVYICGSGLVPSSGSGIATPGAYQTTVGGAFITYLIDSISKLNIHDISPQCEGDSFMTQFFVTANGVLRGTNVFTAEMADATGWFSSPIILGTLTGITGGFIPCRLPIGVSGTRRVRIVSTLPKLISDTTILSIMPLPRPTIVANGNRLSTTGSYRNYQWFRNGIPIPGANGSSYSADSSGIYRVEVTSTSGCKGSAPDFAFTVSIPSLIKGQISVYPNPTKELLHIEGAPNGSRALITDMLGRKLISQYCAAAKQTISLAGLAPGLYQLCLQSSNGDAVTFTIEKR